MEKLYTYSKNKTGGDCGSDNELLIAKFIFKLKKVGETTRSFRYDLNHRDWFPCAGAVLSLAQTHRGRPQTTSTRLYAGGELQGSPVLQALDGHKRRIPLAVVLPPPARGAGTLIPSAHA